MTHLVIGAGQVGTAIYEVLSTATETAIRDINPVEVKSAETIHICFPWSDNDFAWDVEDYRKQHKANLVVVHSTVPMGTCDQHGWVHSPVRGRHPHLTESLLTFTKHFGGRDAEQAADPFQAAGVPVAIHDLARDTEAGKLWELATYGLSVVIEKRIYEYCQQHGLNFNVVYTQFAETYNEGYARLGHDEFLRPILEHIPGPIGGHCVVPGSRMLNHTLADLVLEFS